jgi:2-succinyl-6-hydroxy-2,4-cyclohexadiene-1-carboxylate synthase
MIFELPGIKLHIEFFNSIENENPFIIFLHGFTGSSADWKPVAKQINKNFSSAAIDLIGHGKSSSPSDPEFYTFDAVTEQIKVIIEQVIKKKVILLGYSMGGRAALIFTIKHPQLVNALILESTTAGIKNEKLRKGRIKKDEEIAQFIETHPIEEFLDLWMDMELFNTQRRFSNEKRKLLKQSKLINTRVGLSNSLREFGTGKMPFLFDYLKTIKCKTLLITGELDTKFTNINNEIVRLFPDAVHKIIKNAGHNTHLEEPGKFIQAGNEFLDSK